MSAASLSPSEKPPAVIVLGMHRSGTSLLAEVLSRLGLDLGPLEDLLPADAGNARGYWEPKRLVAIDDRILSAWGGHYQNPRLDASLPGRGSEFTVLLPESAAPQPSAAPSR